MANRIELTGASGQTYSFLPLDPEVDVKPVGVTYVVAERREHGWSTLAVAETNNLAARAWEDGLRQIQRRHPKAQLLVRLNVALSTRLAEVADIASTLATHPPLPVDGVR